MKMKPPVQMFLSISLFSRKFCQTKVTVTDNARWFPLVRPYWIHSFRPFRIGSKYLKETVKDRCNHDHHHHHHHIHFRALFSSTEGWAFWQVFLEGILSTQNDFEGQQKPYLASFCHSQALHPMISLTCQIFSVQPHSACVLLQSSLCCAVHVQTISSYWCRAPHLKSWMPSFVRRESELTSSFALYGKVWKKLALNLKTKLLIRHNRWKLVYGRKHYMLRSYRLAAYK